MKFSKTLGAVTLATILVGGAFWLGTPEQSDATNLETNQEMAAQTKTRDNDTQRHRLANRDCCELSTNQEYRYDNDNAF